MSNFGFAPSDDETISIAYLLTNDHDMPLFLATAIVPTYMTNDNDFSKKNEEWIRSRCLVIFIWDWDKQRINHSVIQFSLF